MDNAMEPSQSNPTVDELRKLLSSAQPQKPGTDWIKTTVTWMALATSVGAAGFAVWQAVRPDPGPTITAASDDHVIAWETDHIADWHPNRRNEEARFAAEAEELGRAAAEFQSVAPEALGMAGAASDTAKAHAAAVMLWLEGLEQARLKNFGKARELYEKALAKHEAIAGLHSSLGRALAEQGEYAGARKAYMRALELDSKDMGALLGMATFEIRERNLAEAERYVERALAINPASELAKIRRERIDQLKRAGDP